MRTQNCRFLASLGMTTVEYAGDERIRANRVWLTFRSLNDCGALSAIAFVVGSAVYLYKEFCIAAVSAAVVRASRPHTARAGCPRDSRQDAGATKIDAC